MELGIPQREIMRKQARKRSTKRRLGPLMNADFVQTVVQVGTLVLMIWRK
jgi:hypothetical protein